MRGFFAGVAVGALLMLLAGLGSLVLIGHVLAVEDPLAEPPHLLFAQGGQLRAIRTECFPRHRTPPVKPPYIIL